MKTWLKISVMSIVSAVSIIGSQVVLAQSLETRAEIAKYSKDYIPEFQSSIASQSGNAKLGKIAVNMDFESFGDNKIELENAARQLFHFKGAVLFLNKNPTARAAIESKIKGIKIVLVPDAKAKKISFKNGIVTMASSSYELGKFHTSEDIKKFLLKSL
ncbi:hypothetical protein [Chamaesiphon minutus]|uniref:Uncharacterized protein n=1 Tax=Chamaesiphon minutus (strain ATCC 27169 / PCC 6605) TaxID=1173020 RepID=K9UK53_CHAP6|nr:hypothetical protein [Chamaesiphon minutus]AFY94584.1 hypothetical protein Cha6605_3600 [Chamaesiphon minutus PCC 6605]